LLLANSCYANNISLNYSQLEQRVNLQDEIIVLKPSGTGANISFDLTSDINLKFAYQTWGDEQLADNLSNVDVDLSTIGSSLSYLCNNWFVSASISVSEDDITYLRGRSTTPYRTEETQTTSLGLNVGYNGLIDNWMYDFSVGVQYTDWAIDNMQIDNQEPRLDDNRPQVSNITTTDDNTTNIGANIALARYWQLTGDHGVLTGAMFSWNYQISGDDELSSGNPPPPPRSNASTGPNRVGGNTSTRATSGDDNYGQIIFYISYDLSASWSVDVDSAIEIASDDDQSWSVGLNYAF